MSGEPLARLLAKGLMRGIVNRVTGNPASGWTKKRMLRSPWMIAPGNAYFWLANATFRMHVGWSSWADYEVRTFEALHGDGAAKDTAARSIWTKHVPGTSLDQLARDGSLGEGSMRRAGLELRRAHAVDVGGAPFSHGDLRLANVLDDEATDRAFLIDFETPHVPHLSPIARRADDVYALLLDLVGAVPERAVGDLSRAFFDGYADRAALAEVTPLLAIDRALLTRALQIVRSRFLTRAELAERFVRLRAALLP